MNMRERYEPTQEQKEKFVPVIKEFIEKASKDANTKDYIDFYGQGISPSQLQAILEDEFGFEGGSLDMNGSDMDYWISLSKNGIDYVITGTGVTFGIELRLA